MRTQIVTGNTFGKWTIIKEVAKINNHRRFLCKCVCGKEKEVDYQHLRTGKSTGCISCGLQLSKRKHGDYETRLYRIWCMLKQRHTKEAYKGIKVCEEWSNSYIKFKEWAIDSGYTEDLTIDRIDGTKDYYPENCRWVTKQVQAENTKLLNRKNTSGFRGVYQRKSEKNFTAYITIQYKRVYLGKYKTKEEAALAYDTYVLKNNLIYRPLNILKR